MAGQTDTEQAVETSCSTRCRSTDHNHTVEIVPRSLLTRKRELISLHFIIIVISLDPVHSLSLSLYFCLPSQGFSLMTKPFMSLLSPPPAPPFFYHPSLSLSNSLCCLSAFIQVFISFQSSFSSSSHCSLEGLLFFFLYLVHTQVFD